MTENEPIKTVSDGITFLSTGRYYDGINRWVAHKLKDGDNDAIDYAARQIAKLLPQNAVLDIMAKPNRLYSWQGLSLHILTSLSLMPSVA